MKFKANDRVITKGNDEEPYNTGRFLHYDKQLTNSKDDIPVVMFDGATEPMMCFGMTIPYANEMTARLDKLNPSEQWDLLTLIRENKAGKQLILMRGCPGSGKSTKARELAGHFGQVFSTDDYFVDAAGQYNWNGNALGKAHDWNQRRSLAAMHANIPIVVIDNTHTTLREMRSYLPHINLARQLGYTVRIAEPDTNWKFKANELFARGTHNVPQEHIEKMLKRYIRDVQVEDIIFLFSHPSTR